MKLKIEEIFSGHFRYTLTMDTYLGHCFACGYASSDCNEMQEIMQEKLIRKLYRLWDSDIAEYGEASSYGKEVYNLGLTALPEALGKDLSKETSNDLLGAFLNARSK